MKRSAAIFYFTVIFLLTACSAEADLNVPASDIQEGRDYTVLPGSFPLEDNSKIEVVEAFWYGCIHCFNLEPEINIWKAALPDDVNFVRLPVIWDKSPIMRLHARMYYANQTLGLEGELHQAIFDEMNTGSKNRLPNEDAVLSFVRGEGVDPAGYERALNSYGVDAQILQAESRTGSYLVRSTPSIIVNRKYQVSTQGGFTRMLQVVSALIEKERAALAN